MARHWEWIDGSLQRILEGAHSSLRSSFTVSIRNMAHIGSSPLTSAFSPAQIPSISPICSRTCRVIYFPSFKDGRTAGESHPNHCRHGDSSVGIDIHCSWSTVFWVVLLDTPSFGGTTGLSFSSRYALLSITHVLCRSFWMLMPASGNAHSGSDSRLD